MSEIERFTTGNFGHMLWDKNGGWVRYQDHLAEVERLAAERDNAQAGDDVALSALTNALRDRDAAQAEIERLTTLLTVERVEQITAERHQLRGDVAALIAERDAALDEVERLRTNRQGILDTSRPTDEDIWREAFWVLLRKTSYAWERLAREAGDVLAEYRKRWPR